MQEKISHIFQAASLSDKCGILLTDEAEMLFQSALGIRPHPTQRDRSGRTSQLPQNGIPSAFISSGFKPNCLQTCVTDIKYVVWEAGMQPTLKH